MATLAPPTRPTLPTTGSSSTNAPTTSSPAAPAASKPPLTISPSAYLDSSSYVLGSHPIQISSNALIHPRARLISSHCPLTIGEGTIITERCIVGGPATATGTNATVSGGASHPSVSASTLTSTASGLSTSSSSTTTIGDKVHLHPSSQIHHSAHISSYTIIESDAQVLSGVRVGEHSKICAGIIVDRDVGDWEVVWGSGTGQRRKRKQGKTEPTDSSEVSKGADDPEEVVEAVRLRALEGERMGTVVVLKAAQAAAAAGKRRK